MCHDTAAEAGGVKLFRNVSAVAYFSIGVVCARDVFDDNEN